MGAGDGGGGRPAAREHQQVPSSSVLWYLAPMRPNALVPSSYVLWYLAPMRTNALIPSADVITCVNRSTLGPDTPHMLRTWLRADCSRSG
eukprot:3726531-Rhodomonas_salina.1